MNGAENRALVIALGPCRESTELLDRYIIKSLHKHVDQLSIIDRKRIIQIIKDVYSLLALPTHLPITDQNWKTMEASRFLLKLQHLFLDFPDEKALIYLSLPSEAAPFLDLLEKSFALHGLAPRYLFAFLHPAVAVSSLRKEYGIDQNLAELVWLRRINDSVLHCQGKCFCLDLGNLSALQKNSVSKQIGVEAYWDNHVSDELIKQMASIDKAPGEAFQATNRLTGKVYAGLQDAVGADRDTKNLVRLLEQNQKQLDEFSGWYRAAQLYYQNSLGAVNESDNLIDLRGQLNKAAALNAAQLLKIKELQERVDYLTIQAFLRDKRKTLFHVSTQKWVKNKGKTILSMAKNKYKRLRE
jgi:hypothetical protein